MPPASGRASTRFRDPHCWPNWSKRPAPSADPNRNPTAPTPLSPATAESETHNTGAAAAPRTTTGEKKKTGSFLSSAPPEAAAGMGNLGVGSKSNLAAGNREASALLGTAPCRCGLHVDVSREEEDGARLCSDGTRAGRTRPPDFDGQGQPAYVANIPSQSGSNLLHSPSKRLKRRFAPTWLEPSTQPNRRLVFCI